MTEGYVPPLGNRLGASLSYFLFATTGTLFYSIFLVALYRGRKKLPNHSFYVFVYHFAVADIGLMAFTNYFVAVPLSFAGRPIYGEGLFLKLISFSDSFFFNAVNVLSFLLSVHRFSVFFFPELSKKLFDRPKIYYVLIIPWIWGFLIDCSFIFIGNCFKIFNPVTFNFLYDCSANTTNIGRIQRQIVPNIAISLPLCSLILYLVVYLKMKSVHQENMSSNQRTVAMEKRRREKSFLSQALIICLSLILESALFHLVPYLEEHEVIDWYWASLSLGWMVIVISSLNPLIYVIFNQTIRTIVSEFLGIKKNNSSLITAVTEKNPVSMMTVRTKRKISVIDAIEV